MVEEYTTIAIYRGDHKKLVDMCKKGESFRDRLHKVLAESEKQKIYKD